MSYLKEDEAMLVKSINTRRYTVTLIEMKEPGYRVCWHCGNEEFESKVITDLSIATQVFDDFLTMLEGH